MLAPPRLDRDWLADAESAAWTTPQNIRRALRQREFSAASEIVSRKRPLTLSMVRALHEKLGIPSELVIREPAAGYRVRRPGGKRTR